MGTFGFIIIVFIFFMIAFVIALAIPIGSYMMSYRDAKEIYEQIYPYYAISSDKRSRVTLDYFEEIETLEYIELETDSYYLKVFRNASKKEVLDSLEAFLKDAMQKAENIEFRNLMDYETLVVQHRELADYCAKVRMLKWNAENN